MAGGHQGASCRLHRLADLRGQSDTSRAEHAARAPQWSENNGWRSERRKRITARTCQLRALRPPLADALHRAQIRPRLPLPWQGSRRGTRWLLPFYRRCTDRRGGGSNVHRRARARTACSNACRRRASRDRSRGRTQAMAARRRAGEVRAERRYHAVDPDNRLVTRGLERAWEESLAALEAAKAELARREQERPRVLLQAERDSLATLGPDLATVWAASTTTPRDRKELLRALIEEVIIKVEREKSSAHVTLRWKGGALSELDLTLPKREATVRTDEDTVALVRRLAAHYPDAVIAGILNRQG